MNIAVCVNHVPDTAALITAAENSIRMTGAVFTLNPYDEYAVEEALNIREASGGTVFIISMGPAANAETIRKALAMGADEGILITTDEQHGSLSVARNLAACIRDLRCDLVITGRQSVDYDNGITGQLLAELLDYNCISVCVSLSIQGTAVTAEREIEGGREICVTSLPAVITAQKGLNTPRYASLKGIMAAKKKVINEIPAVVYPSGVAVQGYTQPAAKTAGRILGSDSGAVSELVRLLHEEARII